MGGTCIKQGRDKEFRAPYKTSFGKTKGNRRFEDVGLEGE
jgi:hypothetical protein